MAAVLVEELAARVWAEDAALARHHADLLRCACATWQSVAARAYRDALQSANGGMTGVETEVQSLHRHLTALAGDLRYGVAGDLVDAQERLADAVLRGYAAPGGVP
ncbi:hypothetical protein V6N00_03065 [Tersicoccus sp. MR15.9]|uniref:hypothetical protein n=1 Tax=Tersicoccus mangrovi TaxID=3121635 RepID=UPI002FE4FFB0